MRVLGSMLGMIVVMALGLGGAYQLVATKPEAEQTVSPSLPPVVEVFALSYGDIPRTFTGYGAARADRQTTVSAEVSGVIVDIPDGFRDGSFVEAGAILARIDARDYVQQLHRAEAFRADAEAQLARLDVEQTNLERLLSIVDRQVEINRSEMTRLADLFEDEHASRSECNMTQLAYQRSRQQSQDILNQINLLPSRRAALEATRDSRLADAELATLNIDRCIVKAPFAGQIEQYAVDLGDRVQIGGPILDMMSTRHIEIPIELPASSRPFVAIDARSVLNVESRPDVTWYGRISRIAPAVDTRSRTYKAYVEVDNAEQDTPIAPGYFVRAIVTGPDLEQVLSVPRGAIIDDHVFVAVHDRAEERSIRVDQFQKTLAIVTGDIQPGDRIIVSNLDILTDGAEITVADVDIRTDGSTHAVTGGDERNVADASDIAAINDAKIAIPRENSGDEDNGEDTSGGDTSP